MNKFYMKLRHYSILYLKGFVKKIERWLQFAFSEEELKKVDNLEMSQKLFEEQNILLSLFNKGESVLFKWKNDEQWSVEYASKSVEKLIPGSFHQFNSGQKSYTSLIHKDDIKRVLAELKQAIDENKETYTHNAYRIVVAQDETKWVLDNSTIQRDVDGNVTYFIGIVTDITEKKRAKSEIIRLNRNLQKEVDLQLEELREKDNIMQEQSNYAQMGEMLNMIAHQWRQPLNVISGSAISLLLSNDMDKIDRTLIHDKCNVIQKQANDMSHIIEDFMDFNKPTNNSEFSLYEAVQRVLNIISKQLENRRILLEVNVDEKIKVFHNSKKIEHAILNILVNSRDAFGDALHENQLIKIYSKINEDVVTLIIEDNAGGISKDILSKVFNPYFTTKEQGKGTGIGLYMSRKMIESVGKSTVDVEVLDTHTLFEIKFPPALKRETL